MGISMKSQKVTSFVTVLWRLDPSYTQPFHREAKFFDMYRLFRRIDDSTLPEPDDSASPQSFPHLKGVIFAAAQESEQAWEDEEGGAFTTTFLKQLKRHPRLSLKRIFDYTAIEMGKFKDQHPKIMGDISLAEKL
jgi:hypothetical protein